MKARFPGLATEIVYESVGGFDVYVRLGIPSDIEESLIEILDASSDLGWRSRDETGVAITAAPVKLEALSHAG